MEGQSLVDQYCPDAHSSPITAAAWDPLSGARITADAWGVVAITQPGQKYPAFIFQVAAAVHGAVAIAPGGALVAVGDDAGTIAVYKTYDASCVFYDSKEGDAGAARAMRAAVFNPQGTIVATLSIDGIIRVYNVARWERIANWQGFGGESLEFDQRGDRLLAIDTLGQPKLLDMVSQEQIDLENVPGGVQVARFSPDGRHVVCMGLTGITLLEMPDGRVVNSFTARGSSGMLNLLLSPDGSEVAAVTARSIHRFSLPDLQPVASEKHGAAEPTKAAMWDSRGIAVGGADGQLHRPDSKPSLEAVVCVTGYGENRVAVHGDKIAVWEGTRRRRPFSGKRRFVEVKIDRDGRLLLALPGDGAGVQVFEAKSGRHLFDAGPETADTPKMEVGGTVVATMLSRGGLRWYDLKANNVFELPWVQNFALSGGGTWLGVTTPKGAVRVLDPATGKDAIPAPEPLADVPIRLLSFVNRRPDMLVLDDEGVLSTYDLAVSVKENRPAKGRDVLDFNVAVDRLWGITGGRYAAIRFQEYEQGTATVLTVDLEKGEVVAEVPNLLPYVWVDPESGAILQPARGGAIVELDMYGREQRVYRTLPETRWICFGPHGVIDRDEEE